MPESITTFFRKLGSIPPVFIDGATFVAIQMLTFLSAAFGTDEAAKYITPVPLFWIKIIVGEMASGFLALKMFRSTSYAESKRDEQNKNSNGGSTG